MFTNIGDGMQGQSPKKIENGQCVLNIKKGLVKHVNSKRRPKENTGPILVEDGPLTNRNAEKLRYSVVFFASALNNSGRSQS